MSSVNAFPFGPHEKSYNEIAAALEDFFAAVNWPVSVPGVAGQAGGSLPYDQEVVTHAVRRVAHQVARLDEAWRGTPSPGVLGMLPPDRFGSTFEVFSPEAGRLARQVMELTEAQSVELKYFHGPSGTVTPLVSDLMARVSSEVSASKELEAARASFSASVERSSARFADPWGDTQVSPSPQESSAPDGWLSGIVRGVRRRGAEPPAPVVLD